MTSLWCLNSEDPHGADAAADAVGMTLAALYPGDARGLAAMREAVAAFGRHAQFTGTPPQEMLVDLKALFRATACRHQGAPQVEALLDRAVTWAIRGYYGHADTDAPDATASPPHPASRAVGPAVARSADGDDPSC